MMSTVYAEGARRINTMTRGPKSTTREFQTLEPSPNTGGLSGVFPAQSQGEQRVISFTSQCSIGIELNFGIYA